MKRQARVFAERIDQIISRSWVSLFQEKSSLITLLFHGLFSNMDEIALNHVDPQQMITTDMLRQCMEHFLKHQYSFVSPSDITKGLGKSGKCVLLTFDDGYCSNRLALSLLKEYRVPATFFISTNHIRDGKCFWWDVLYRQYLKNGYSDDDREKMIKRLETMQTHEIESLLVKEFGGDVMRPLGDIDRPFRPDELAQFAQEELVSIGNHTSNHAILANYSTQDIRMEIESAQKYLADITGIRPFIISYPHGIMPAEFSAIMQDCGITAGISTVPRKNYLPLNSSAHEMFALGRFTLWGNKDVDVQCSAFRSDLQVLSAIRRLSRKSS